MWKKGEIFWHRISSTAVATLSTLLTSGEERLQPLSVANHFPVQNVRAEELEFKDQRLRIKDHKTHHNVEQRVVELQRFVIAEISEIFISKY